MAQARSASLLPHLAERVSCCTQGLKGVIRSRDRAGIGAVVQAVQVPGGVWVRGATISVFTDYGVLALEASSPASFMLWCAPGGAACHRRHLLPWGAMPGIHCARAGHRARRQERSCAEYAARRLRGFACLLKAAVVSRAMGLNAALAASHTRRPNVLLAQPLHIIPRDGSFVLLG